MKSIDRDEALALLKPERRQELRERAHEVTGKCVYVGMSAGIAGPLLTTPGADFNDDRELALRAGYSIDGR